MVRCLLVPVAEPWESPPNAPAKQSTEDLEQVAQAMVVVLQEVASYSGANFLNLTTCPL